MKHRLIAARSVVLGAYLGTEVCLPGLIGARCSHVLVFVFEVAEAIAHALILEGAALATPTEAWRNRACDSAVGVVTAGRCFTLLQIECEQRDQRSNEE